MLPTKHRLTKKKDFEMVFTRGDKNKHRFLLVRSIKNNLPEDRFGFVVSKKISPKATVRNLVKRRLRQAVAQYLIAQPGNNSAKRLDVVIITLPGAERQSFADSKEAVQSLLKKILIP